MGIQDSEYIRGVAEIYMAFEPLAGKHYVSLEEDREPGRGEEGASDTVRQ